MPQHALTGGGTESEIHEAMVGTPCCKWEFYTSWKDISIITPYIRTLDIIRYMCTWAIWIGYQPLTIASMHYQVPADKANCSRNGSPQALQPTVLVSEN